MVVIIPSGKVELAPKITYCGQVKDGENEERQSLNEIIIFVRIVVSEVATVKLSFWFLIILKVLLNILN